MKSITEQIECARRELKMRQRVYPKLVLSERMSKETALHEVQCMQAIIQTLEDHEQPPLPQDLFYY